MAFRLATASTRRIFTPRPFLSNTNTPRLFHSTAIKMGVTEIKSFEQFKEVINGSKPVVVDFWATWCGPCKMISPIFEKISDTPAGEAVGFYKVDVDDQEQVAQEVGIKAMPTFVVFKGGEKVDTIVGADPSKLQATISKYAS